MVEWGSFLGRHFYKGSVLIKSSMMKHKPRAGALV